jgi:hypothetical protein
VGISPEAKERWSSQVEVLTLKHCLPLRLSKGSNGFDVFCKPLKIVGSGNTLEKAMEMFFDHLIVEYYEYSLNPGVQSADDEAYGRKLKKLFNTTGQEFRKNLLDFSCES